MKVVIIGGTGHIGTYLVPRLVDAGHEVVVVSRGQSKPYVQHPAWNSVKYLHVDRRKCEQDGTFGVRISELQPEVVIDLISFTLESTRHLAEALMGKVQHFIHCGSIWVKGFVVTAPTHEEDPSPPLEEYGINKAKIEQYLHEQARKGNLSATVVLPGHIVGPGHAPINPVGNKDTRIFEWIAHGEAVEIPNFGMETLHHVHADDVAQVFIRAVENWSVAVGESFYAVSPAAVTLRGYAETVAGWFGAKPNLKFLPWEEWKRVCPYSQEDINMSYAHIIHCQCCSTQKSERLLGYRPRYTSFAAIREAIDWMIANKLVKVSDAVPS